MGPEGAQMNSVALTEGQQALANARAYNRVQPRSKKLLSVAEALASC